MEKIIDPSDGKETFHSPISIDGFGLIAKTSHMGEEYYIQFYEPGRIEKDSREAIIRIYHYPPFKGKPRRKFLHGKIEFVMDLRGHDKMTFHLNLSGKSKEICKRCPKCRKYLLPLNHLEIVAEKGIGTGEPYKIIDLNLTAAKFKKELEGRGLFKEFKKTSEYKIY